MSMMQKEQKIPMVILLFLNGKNKGELMIFDLFVCLFVLFPFFFLSPTAEDNSQNDYPEEEEEEGEGEEGEEGSESGFHKGFGENHQDGSDVDEYSRMYGVGHSDEDDLFGEEEEDFGGAFSTLLFLLEKNLFFETKFCPTVWVFSFIPFFSLIFSLSRKCAPKEHVRKCEHFLSESHFLPPSFL